MGSERQEETPIFPLIITRVTATTSDVEEFVARYFRNFTADIVFVPTEAIQPPGRRVRFVFALADGRDLVTGEGVVLRMRRDSGDAARPAGMDLRYQVLDEGSQRVVDRLLERGSSPPAPPPPYVSMSFGGETGSVTLPGPRSPAPLPPAPLPPAPLPLAPLPPPATWPTDQRRPTLPANPLAEVTAPSLAAFVEHALVDQTRRWQRWRPPSDLTRFAAGFATGAALLALVGLIGFLRRPHTVDSPSPAIAAAAAASAPAAVARAATGGNGIVASDDDSEGAAPPAAVGPRPTTAGGVRPFRRSVTLSITTLPPGSTVFVDGEARGPSPLVLAVAPGAHDVVAERARYATAHAHVDGPGHVQLTQERPRATLRVTSLPPGAEVRLDGRRVGTTPLEIPCAGYELHRLQLDNGERTARRRVYVRPPMASVTVEMTPVRRPSVDQTRPIRVAHDLR
ncbi:MAG: Heat shock protein Hsp70 family protein [Myxococcales bacterium]|nr:Heat shock protein Hsp70 family protein [Myxococcales bacterium]